MSDIIFFCYGAAKEFAESRRKQKPLVFNGKRAFERPISDLNGVRFHSDDEKNTIEELNVSNDVCADDSFEDVKPDINMLTHQTNDNVEPAAFALPNQSEETHASNDIVEPAGVVSADDSLQRAEVNGTANESNEEDEDLIFVWGDFDDHKPLTSFRHGMLKQENDDLSGKLVFKEGVSKAKSTV